MMGIMVPETCRASSKICNKNRLLHLVGICFKHDEIYSHFFRLYERLQCCLRELLIALISEMKNNSGTIEISYTPAISYLNVIF
jgi:hypothetical protein